MSMALAFWIIMLVWAIWSIPANRWSTNVPYAGPLLLFILFVMIGWHVFGPPIR